MRKILLFSIFFSLLFSNPLTTFAGAGTKVGGDLCTLKQQPDECTKGYSCLPDIVKTSQGVCQPDSFGENFGKIQPPEAIKNFIGIDQTGSGAISKFLTNLIGLIYVIATIVLIFMILWGAFDWLTSGGDKEKVAGARERITQAFIGLMLFAVAFAVISVVGQFTGFKFFVGQP